MRLEAAIVAAVAALSSSNNKLHAALNSIYDVINA
jgi:hypothetical protein